MFDEHRLSHDRTDPARTCEPGNGRDEMNEQDEQGTHLRILAKPHNLRNGGPFSNSPRTACDTSNVSPLMGHSCVLPLECRGVLFIGVFRDLYPPPG